MDVRLQLLELFLVGDAEALFLVDDDETEALEFDRLGQQGVRADDDVDCARGKACFGLRCFLEQGPRRVGALLVRVQLRVRG